MGVGMMMGAPGGARLEGKLAEQLLLTGGCAWKETRKHLNEELIT